MDMPEQARRWQQTFDQDFPKGVLASFEDSPNASAVHSPRVEVVALRGLDPVVFLDIPSFEHNVTGTVGSYDKLQDSPHLLARVMLTDHAGRVMLWSAGLSPREADVLAPLRRKSLELSAQGKLFQ